MITLNILINFMSIATRDRNFSKFLAFTFIFKLITQMISQLNFTTNISKRPAFLLYCSTLEHQRQFNQHVILLVIAEEGIYYFPTTIFTIPDLLSSKLWD